MNLLLFDLYLLNNFNIQPQPLTQGQILFTYDVIFEKSNKTFALRWDHYKTSNTKIHWIGIFLSESIIFGLTLFIIIILVKNINTEIDLYNTQILYANNYFMSWCTRILKS